MVSSEVREMGKLVAEVMQELRIARTPVTVTFDSRSDRAGSTRDGLPYSPLRIRISSRKAIHRLMPELSAQEIRAKQISQVAEEFGHFAEHEDCHTPKVVATTIRVMKKHMTSKQYRSGFIQDKIENLREVSRSSDKACG